jgi:hypothetical protein
VTDSPTAMLLTSLRVCSPSGAIEAEGAQGTVTHHVVNTSIAAGVLAKWPQRRPGIYEALSMGPDPAATEPHAHSCGENVSKTK